MNYEPLYEFIEGCCLKYGIDESHGLKHSKGCISWVEKLLSNETDVGDDERKMAIYSAALHDMCDKKYTNPAEASTHIHSWLLTQGWDEEMANSLLKIINSMSYSALKKLAKDGVPVFPEHGTWQRAYHLARHADLLDAYLVGRCFLYTKHISPDIADEECWKIVEDLFKVRVFQYVVGGWIFLPKAIEYANELDALAKLSFLEKRWEY